MKKPKLHFNFRRNHLIPLIGFRTDLYDKNPPWGKMQESTMIEIEKVDWNNKKIIVKLIHVVYDNNVGKHIKGASWKKYEIDLKQSWGPNEKSVIKEIK